MLDKKMGVESMVWDRKEIGTGTQKLSHLPIRKKRMRHFLVVLLVSLGATVGCASTKFWGTKNVSGVSALTKGATGKSVASGKGPAVELEKVKPNTKQAQIDFLVVAAEQSEANQDYRTAMSKYKEILAIDKKNAMAHHRLALVAIHLSANQQAAEHFEEALKLAPRDEDVAADVAYWRYLNGDDIGAMKEVERGLGIHPQSARLHGIKGLLHSRSQEIDLAIHEYQLAGCTKEQAMANLGHVVLMEGNVQAASYWIQKATEGPGASTTALRTQRWLDEHAKKDSVVETVEQASGTRTITR